MAGQVAAQVQGEQKRRAALGLKPKTRFPRPPKPLSTRPTETSFAKELSDLMRRGKAMLDETVLSQLDRIGRQAGIKQDSERQDSWQSDLRALVGDFRGRFARESQQSFEQALEAAQSSIDQKTAKSFRRQMARMIGVDVFSQVPDMPDILDAWREENKRLWTNVTNDFASDVEGVVLRDMQAGQRRSAIAEKIQERFGVARRRAILIATDQVQKLNGELTKRRQQAAGIEQYRWQTSVDERVRKSHRALHGRVFSWDDPPPEGHPGQPVRCRCFAAPVLEDLLGDEGKRGQTFNETAAAIGADIDPDKPTKAKKKPAAKKPEKQEPKAKPKPKKTHAEKLAEQQKELDKMRERTKQMQKAAELAKEVAERTKEEALETQKAAQKKELDNLIARRKRAEIEAGQAKKNVAQLKAEMEKLQKEGVKTTKAQAEERSRLIKEIIENNLAIAKATKETTAQMKKELARLREQDPRVKIAKLEKQLAKIQAETRAIDLANTKAERSKKR